jgi:hypothetical protein
MTEAFYGLLIYVAHLPFLHGWSRGETVVTESRRSAD